MCWMFVGCIQRHWVLTINARGGRQISLEFVREGTNFSLYSVLTKIGIKCEIHSCTIAFAKRFLTEFLSEDDLDFTEDSLKARIDSQYYIDRTVPDEQYNKMVKNAPEFLVKCKSILIKLNEKKINEVRTEFQKALAEKRQI